MGYRVAKNYVKPFRQNTDRNVTDGQTDRIAISISRVSKLTRDNHKQEEETWLWLSVNLQNVTYLGN